ncbi:MAG: sigma 54-interacting transcriptional regulator [Kofleriaceae bacterium]
MQDGESPTWVTHHIGGGLASSLVVRRCRLEVVAGPDLGLTAELAQPTIVVGRGSADFNLTDPKVSGLHAEIRLMPEGYRVRDLGSTNGTHVKGVRLVEGFISPGATISVGKTAITFTPLSDVVDMPLWPEARYEGLVGKSAPIRQVFELIDRFAPSDATVLIHGETGTGKELVAEAVHRRSRRAAAPFNVLDCSAIPEQLFEDQLFGHETGAFTGANRQTAGVFEASQGGTVFLDEIGELPLEMQSKLLRVLESRQVRRIGSNRLIRCDVRIVAATNRDLAVEVNRGSFRQDIYYRLAVAKLVVPPLRERQEDLEVLIDHFCRQLDPQGLATLPEDFLGRAQRHSWPGNIRELRNAVERALLMPHHAELGIQVQAAPVQGAFAQIDPSVPFKVAKQQFIDEFDRRYLEAILANHEGNISAAARAAGIDRMTIYKMLRRLDMEQERDRWAFENPPEE